MSRCFQFMGEAEVRRARGRLRLTRREALKLDLEAMRWEPAHNDGPDDVVEVKARGNW